MQKPNKACDSCCKNLSQIAAKKNKKVTKDGKPIKETEDNKTLPEDIETVAGDDVISASVKTIGDETGEFDAESKLTIASSKLTAAEFDAASKITSTDAEFDAASKLTITDAASKLTITDAASKVTFGATGEISSLGITSQSKLTSAIICDEDCDLENIKPTSTCDTSCKGAGKGTGKDAAAEEIMKKTQKKECISFKPYIEQNSSKIHTTPLDNIKTEEKKKRAKCCAALMSPDKKCEPQNSGSMKRVSIKDVIDVEDTVEDVNVIKCSDNTCQTQKKMSSSL